MTIEDAKNDTETIEIEFAHKALDKIDNIIKLLEKICSNMQKQEDLKNNVSGRHGYF